MGTIWSVRRASGEHHIRITARRYVRGLLISLTNPKIILSFAAVLPHFLGEAQNTGFQLAMLGAVNVMMEVVPYGALGLLAGTFNARFTSSRQEGATLSYIGGAVYFGLAGVAVVDVVGVGFLP